MSGFTLIEIMTVVSIIAIMLAIAVPGMQEFVADQRVRTVASDITSEISLARAKAIESSHRVIMQKLPTSVFWRDGWRLYVDMNDNGAYNAGTDLELKSVTPINTGNIYICTIPAFPGSQIIFRPDGRIVRTGAVTAIDGIYVIDTLGDTSPTNDKIRGIQFGLSGRTTQLKLNGTNPLPCVAN